MKTRIGIFLILSLSLVLGQGRGGGGGRQLTWDESLNLTTEQMQQITELREAIQPAMQSIRQNNRSLERELRQLNRDGSSDAERVTELETAIAANEAAMSALMEGHRNQIRELLTAEQQLIFDQHQFGPREDRGPRQNDRRGNGPDGPRGNHRGSGRW